MSATAITADQRPGAPATAVPPGRRPAGSWLAWTALALYGTARWSTLLGAGGAGRLFLMLALAGLLAAAMRRLRRLPRPAAPLRAGLTGLFGLLALAAILIGSGVAATTLVTLHWGRVADGIAAGLGALPGLLVPYRGNNPHVTVVIVLGAALLLGLSATAFGTVRDSPASGRLGLSAVALLPLGVIPSAIVAPRLLYLHALITALLAAALALGPRVHPSRRGAATGTVIAAAVIGAIGLGASAGSRVALPFSSGERLVVSDAAAAEVFNWQQTYGAAAWPRTGASVLTVSAAHPAYWKAEDLDAFNGRSWVASPGGPPALLGVSAAHRRADTQTLTVEVGAVYSKLVFAAGTAAAPRLPDLSPGAGPGTWVTAFLLQSGDRYRVRVYTPTPTAAQLTAAGSRVPAALAPFTRLPALPAAYAPVVALARRLTAGAPTIAARVAVIENYLRHGFRYTLTPPPGGSAPLVSFLDVTHAGYCQQFAGAMALLLRLAHIPARVAVGFSTGTRRPGSHTYLVSDRDAHAWVEVWFPGWGWVTVDPTPAGAATPAVSAPVALPATLPTPAGSAVGRTGGRAHGPRPPLGGHARLAATGRGGGALGSPNHRTGGGLPVLVILAGGGVLLAGLALSARRRWRLPPSWPALSAECERAYRVCGRPLSPGATWRALAGDPGLTAAAARYLSDLEAARFGAGGRAPALSDRAALRRALAAGHGWRGWLRAVRALPPARWRPPAGAAA
ncbi:transglutaminase-like domain-containing protein [Conexibacter sp. DBS9H8]|uniref:transglutaminase-like domain-containing protein n=1 Tax=Conexibacter sp. DBS9H8 TaxID=2937801 RepID=UPI0020102CD5|nr:transglutaminase-like domain-containing protein [Conexibacter sp. DBS9H8]